MIALELRKYNHKVRLSNTNGKTNVAYESLFLHFHIVVISAKCEKVIVMHIMTYPKCVGLILK